MRMMCFRLAFVLRPTRRCGERLRLGAERFFAGRDHLKANLGNDVFRLFLFFTVRLGITIPSTSLAEVSKRQ
jgi:hypothetical protein